MEQETTMSSSSYKNVFQCECSPQHDFHSLEDFNKHFSSLYHRYHECASNSLFQNFLRMEKEVQKLKQERDMWKNLYQEELMKDTSV